MDHVPAGQDHHPVPAQRGQPGGEVDVVLQWLQGVDGELHDRDVGVGIHVREDGPRAVVDAPAVVVEPDPLRCSDLRHLGGDLGCPRAGVLDREQLVGEPEEVVDRTRRLHGGDRGGVGVPVRGDAQDGARPGHGGAEPGPGLGVAVVRQGVHRVAVAHEHHR